MPLTAPTSSRPRALHRVLILGALLAGALVVLPASPALASRNQEAIFQDDTAMHADAEATLEGMRALGVERVRLFVSWASIAPSPKSSQKPSFDASDPAQYPSQNWVFYDAVVRRAQQLGIKLDLTLIGGTPLWASGSGAPRGGKRDEWKPSATEFGLFVKAVGTRYNGSYPAPDGSGTLPRVDFWAVWNEPNYGQWLAPQATRHSTVEVAPALYRGLLDAAWSSLRSTGHSHDTILIGEIAPRGLVGGDVPGNYGGMVPLRFLRALYCVDSSYRSLRGSSATARGCPSRPSARAFVSAHPALFQAGGFADHPYPQHSSPITQTWPYSGSNQYADFPELPVLMRVLDRLQRAYGSHKRFNVYSTEYGYRTNPPERGQPSPSTAGYWINWAEYLSWRNSRVSSYMQYLLNDPPGSSYPAGLVFHNGSHKATYDAFRMPLYLPSTSTRHGHSLEVWGCVRPAHFARSDTGQTQHALIQYRRGSHGSYSTIKTVTVSGTGYFDVRISFPASGSVRVAWVDPLAGGATVYSRTQSISIH